MIWWTTIGGFCGGSGTDAGICGYTYGDVENWGGGGKWEPFKVLKWLQWKCKI